MRICWGLIEDDRVIGLTLSRWLCLPHTSFVSLLVGFVKERTLKASVRKNEKSRRISPVV